MCVVRCKLGIDCNWFCARGVIVESEACVSEAEFIVVCSGALPSLFKAPHSVLRDAGDVMN